MEGDLHAAGRFDARKYAYVQNRGGKLSGTVARQAGESKFDNGTIKGDDIAFTVVRNFGGNDITFNYKGKVTGNKIAFKVSAGERELDVTAVKQ